MQPYTATDMLYAIKHEYGFDGKSRPSNDTPHQQERPASGERRGLRAWMHSVVAAVL